MSKKHGNTPDEFSLGDIGGIDIPEIDINLFDFLPADEVEETRYTLPKVVPMQSDYVCYDNAKRMAEELRLDFGNASTPLLAEILFSETSSRRIW